MTHVFRKTISPLLWRVIVFLGLFVLISGAIGPRVISGKILYHDGFAAYGGIGKAMMFGLIAFVLLARRNTLPVALRPWQPRLLGWGAGAAVAFALAWTRISLLLEDHRNAPNLVAAHAGLLLAVALAGVCCFGLQNLRALWQHYQREIAGALALAVLFYFFLLAVYALWRPLASVVLHSVNGLLGSVGLHAVIAPPFTLMFDKFGITVAQYCSGIESIALFTGLYAVVGLLDWERLRKGRYFAVFWFALLGLFALNIVRVFGLILAGYYINPQIAFSLFHTYAGMIFFIIYSAIFWSIAYKHLLQKPYAPSAQLKGENDA